MAIHGLTLSATKEYVSEFDTANVKADPDKGIVASMEGCTMFVLGALDSFVMAHVFDAGVKISAGEIDFRSSQADVERVRFGLKGWRNFQGDKGEIKFETQTKLVLNRSYDVVSDSCLRLIPMPIMTELSREIRDMSTVTQDEAKN